jgi:polyisoprenoid-binding protein YceI
VHHFGVTDMVCVFNEIAGAVVMDTNDISKSSVEVTINAQSLDSEFQDRVDAVKSEFFLNVEKHPEITFKSKKVRNDDDTYHVVGDLTVNGVTKEVEFPFVLKGPRPDPWGNDRMGIAGSLTINRRDFEINFDRKMKDGTPLIGDEVRINLSVEAVKM